MKTYTFVDYATQAFAALVAVLILLFHNDTVAAWPWLIAAHVFILLFIHGLIRLHDRYPGSKALDFLRHLYPVPLYLWFFSETGWLNRMFFRDYMDPTVIGWDQALFGFQPSVVFMAKLPHPLVSETFYACYFSYYVMIVGVAVALYIRSRRQFFHYVSIVSFVFYVCYTIYIIVPVIGPRVFFARIGGYVLPQAYQELAAPAVYPEAVQHGPFFHLMAWIYELFEAPGSAIPSSHVAVALCTVYFSFRYLRRIRFIHLVVALLLCLATIYCRYHYAVDVLAGALTAGVLLPVGNWLYFRFARDEVAEVAATKPGAKQRELCM